ncbi:MAG: hypothetical protein M1820_007468 [Bogoriella megaspora]|nr:MAG: hypothetical protein M1820_007468 [Bogoriella megaspora]
MASFALNVTDILKLCRFAWDTTVKLKNAPSDLQEVASEGEVFSQLLSQVDQELKDPFSPVQVNDNGRRFMQQYIPEYTETLYNLQLKCSKYEKMDVKARVGFVAANFSTERKRLKEHRDNIGLQMHIGTHNTLSKILKEIHRFSADARAGRMTTIISGQGTVALSRASSPEIKDIIKENVHRSAPDLPGAAIDQNWAQIEPYVQMIREKGGFDESCDGVESIHPSDSASHIEKTPSSPQSFQMGGMVELGCLTHYRSVPIQQASLWTIRNPAIDYTGHDLADTSDIWGLTTVCTKIRNLCMERIRAHDDPYDSTASQYRRLHEQLGIFTPALLLSLTSSSSDQHFWDRLPQRLEFVKAGRSLLQRLNVLLKRLDPPSDVHSTTNSEMPISRRERFRALRGFMIPKKLERSTSRRSKDDFELCSAVLEDVCVDCRAFTFSFIGQMSDSWDLDDVRDDQQSGGAWQKAEFETEIAYYFDKWWKRVKAKVEGLDSLSSYEVVDKNLLENWICASQGIDVQNAPKRGLDILLDQISFKRDLAWELDLSLIPSVWQSWRQRNKEFSKLQEEVVCESKPQQRGNHTGQTSPSNGPALSPLISENRRLCTQTSDLPWAEQSQRPLKAFGPSSILSRQSLDGHYRTLSSGEEVQVAREAPHQVRHMGKDANSGDEAGESADDNDEEFFDAEESLG